MKKQIIDVDKKQGIFRVTLPDERWYAIPDKSKKSGLPEYRFYPSVTWITSHYPKGIGFYKWLANKGWDEAEALKEAAGDKGSRVHYALEDIINKKTVTMESIYEGRDGAKELSVEEYRAIMTFVDWANAVKPKFLHTETFAVSDKYQYAGTVDCVAEINGETFIIDWKTSKNLWPEYELQLSAYKEALVEMKLVKPNTKIAILQVGYDKNKQGYKFTPIEHQFHLFLAARSIFQKEQKGVTINQRDYPLELKLNY